jgi:uncharacterized protein with GYD domain
MIASLPAERFADRVSKEAGGRPMATYIMLATSTEQGMRTIKDFAGRLQTGEQMFKSLAAEQAQDADWTPGGYLPA